MRCLGDLFKDYLVPLFELIHKQYEVILILKLLLTYFFFRKKHFQAIYILWK